MEHGSLLPEKLPFRPHPSLSQFCPPPVKAPSQPRRCPTHSNSLLIHSFICSTNIQAPTVCQSLHQTLEMQGCQTEPACQTLLGTGQGSLCSSHSRHIPYKAISSENHGFFLRPHPSAVAVAQKISVLSFTLYNFFKILTQKYLYCFQREKKRTRNIAVRETLITCLPYTP